MTYPKGETEEERIFAKLNQYNILNYKPKGTPKEQAIMNAAILSELLKCEALKNILSYTLFKGLQLVAVTEKQRLLPNWFARFTGFPDLNSNPQVPEMPQFVEMEVPTGPPNASLLPQSPNNRFYSFDTLNTAAEAPICFQISSSNIANDPLHHQFGDAETLLAGIDDTNATAAAEETTLYLSAHFGSDTERLEPIVNAARASTTERQTQSVGPRGLRRLKPNPRHALYMPASFDGTHFTFTFNTTAGEITLTEPPEWYPGTRDLLQFSPDDDNVEFDGIVLHSADII